ncbi:MAG TPA: hypothetical protein VKA36_01910 [Solirubrobacterales bacterium]|nr:hypothetical protein [Solirubrobacterales bacterium]
MEWSDEVDDVIGGDAAAGVAYLTPAKGVVITPMSPLGLRDRERGTVTITTSLGLWKKLARIRDNPGVAIAFHAREHGFSSRPDFVLVQGRARIQDRPDREWLESITPQWERFLGRRERGSIGRLMRVYYWERVGVEVTVERILRWDGPRCEGEFELFGAPFPDEPPPQREPGKGIGPRVDCARAAQEAARLPHVLLGWNGRDDLPAVVAARAVDAGEEGVRLVSDSGMIPPGGRRAGLVAHAFAARMQGQEQRIYTGWMRSGGGSEALYAPHTRAGSRLPESRVLFDVGAGVLTRLGIRGAREAGLAA